VRVFSEHMTGLDFYLDPSVIDAEGVSRIQALLAEAMAALRGGAAGSSV
jgi:adenylate cyclase